MIFPPQGVAKSITSADIVAGTIVNSDISSSAAIAASKIAVLATEASTTNNSAAANDTVLNTTNRYYSFFTLPSAASFYRISGIEWKNGTVVAGSVMAHVDRVDASPPTRNASVLVCHSLLAGQSGESVVQRTSEISPNLVPGGTLLGVSIVSNSATARFLTATVASNNNFRAIALSQGTLNGSSVAWQAGTEEPYLKLYYVPVL